MIIPGLLTNLCRAELPDSISVSEPGAVGGGGGGQLEGKKSRQCKGDSFVFHTYLMWLFYQK